MTLRTPDRVSRPFDEATFRPADEESGETGYITGSGLIDGRKTSVCAIVPDETPESLLEGLQAHLRAQRGVGRAGASPQDDDYSRGSVTFGKGFGVGLSGFGGGVVLPLAKNDTQAPLVEMSKDWAMSFIVDRVWAWLDVGRLSSTR